MENKSGSMNEKMFSQEHDTERTINKKFNYWINIDYTFINTNIFYKKIHPLNT